MSTDLFLNELSFKLAKLHSIKLNLPKTKFRTHFEKMMSQNSMIKMQRELDKKIGLIKQHPYINFPSMDSLFVAEKNILDKLSRLDFSEIAICHNDLSQRNIIWNSKDNSLGLIDFELIMHNYIAMEFGYLFVYYTGHYLTGFDRKKFPDKKYRYRFLRQYLKHKNGSIDNNKLELLFIQTNLCILYHLLSIAKELPLYDLEPQLKNELKKVSKDDDFYFGRIAFESLSIFDENKDEFIESADNYLSSIKI